jgi:hypothetical protein
MDRMTTERKTTATTKWEDCEQDDGEEEDTLR